ncbi:arylamine N-acetyltransferase family protein [Phytohabitans houttuyneae]|uniref:N-hydroxyarylamine O-acetyltransferase n=1 Tax=Phytohabitans houttuyneae TaxID=1076126 RepID=A0A6V8KGN1_9ACTN|nr:arylamine N-acetyltransferase [Phytohabitans houttuyneae]GFJ84393.1 N-hydroxyarylamine O-acetyltransferase [Phytohabitans houttuyneae]
MAEEPFVADYLARIGLPGAPPAADLSGLRLLQRAHLGTVPFENLSIHLGERVDLTTLPDKVVKRRRGGFCYELNGSFARLLTALGYQVTLHSARVWGGKRWGPPFDHLALRVELDEPWLVDVGFGRFAHHPLRLSARQPQDDPAGSFTVVDAESGFGDVEVVMDGEPQYRVDPRPYELADFTPTCWWHSTSPDSHFTRSLTCSMLGADGGRVTLSGDRLIVTGPAGGRDETVLDGDAAVLAAYRDRFGIVLDRVPRVAA